MSESMVVSPNRVGKPTTQVDALFKRLRVYPSESSGATVHPGQSIRLITCEWIVVLCTNPVRVPLALERVVLSRSGGE